MKNKLATKSVMSNDYFILIKFSTSIGYSIKIALKYLKRIKDGFIMIIRYFFKFLNIELSYLSMSKIEINKNKLM